MVVILQNTLDSKEELDKEIQSQLIIFILFLEILFIFIKFNKNIDGINIFNHEYLYTAYADDATFFLKSQTSEKNVLNDIETFSNFSGLRSDLDKCEIARIGVLKNVNVAICGNINLTKKV